MHECRDTLFQSIIFKFNASGAGKQKKTPRITCRFQLRPMIEKYSFGHIVINGKSYNSDLLVFPDGSVHDNWRRKQGHKLLLEDLVELVAQQPEIIIAGTGAYGIMKPEKNLDTELSVKGIELRCAPSKKAVEIYNKLLSDKKAGACFHLTC
ncbi:MAG: hypothetical protein GF350_14245 [Chitinivibrionales bacterium]|nr:hypothetical protein [Chitinivibrionales bacterium]